MIVTTKIIMALKPCPDWPIRRVRAILGEGKTPLEICDDERILLRDRIWALIQIPKLFDISFIVGFAQGCADRAARAASDSARRAASDSARWAEASKSAAADEASKSAAADAAKWALAATRYAAAASSDPETECQIQLSEIRAELLRIENKEA